MNIIKFEDKEFKIPNLELNLHPREIYLPSDNEYRLILDNNYKCYINVYNHTYQAKEYIAVQYRVYFIYNGAVGIGHQFFPNNKLLGFHEKDAENIVILYNKDTLEPVYTYFSAHRFESKWYKFQDCNFNDQGDLKVYIALNSHAFYKDYGTWFRIFGFANDHCSKRGQKIIPELIQNNKYKINLYNYEKKSEFLKRFFATSDN